MRTDYHHLIVGKTPEITDDLSSQSYEFQFEYLDDASLLARSGKVKSKRQSNAPVRWSSCVLKLMDGQRT